MNKFLAAAIATLLAFGALNLPAHGADSEDAKVDLSSVTITPSNPSMGESIDLAFRATDDVHVKFVSVYLFTPEPNRTSIQGFSALRVSGDAKDGLYSVKVTFPSAPYEPGRWEIVINPVDLYNKGAQESVFIDVSSQLTKEQTEVPHVTFQKETGKLTALVEDGIPGQKLAFKIGTRLFVSEIFKEGDFKQIWHGYEDDPHSIRMLVNGPPYVNANFTFSIVTVSLPTVTQRTLASFKSSSTGLNNQQRAQVLAAVESNPSADKFICTGIRYESQPMTENLRVRKRAKAACDYAKSLNPSLSTWYQNKPTQARSYAGKVLLTVKTPRN